MLATYVDLRASHLCALGFQLESQWNRDAGMAQVETGTCVSCSLIAWASVYRISKSRSLNQIDSTQRLLSQN
jgi:hypothetical protein